MPGYGSPGVGYADSPLGRFLDQSSGMLLPFVSRRPRQQQQPAPQTQQMAQAMPAAPQSPRQANAQAADVPLPQPAFSGQQAGQQGFMGGTGTGTTPAAMALAALGGRTQGSIPAPPVPNPPATLPVVYNGDQREQSQGGQTGSPIQDIVARSLGGQNGQIPSLQRFLGSMPQDVAMDFGSGQGQISNGLGIGGPLTQNYTPAHQSPIRSSDNTAAAMQAYSGLLHPLTAGPESPSQAMDRANSALARTLEANARYRPGGLEEQRIGVQRELADKEFERQLATFEAAWRNQGHSPQEIARRVAEMRGNRPGAQQPGGSLPVGAMPAFQQAAGTVAQQAGRQAAGGALPEAADLQELFRQAMMNRPGAPATVPGQPNAEPQFLALDQQNRDRVLTNFVNGLPQSQLQTPHGINQLRNFLVAPNAAGQADFDRWFTARHPMLFASPEDQARKAAVQRLIQARNSADPNNPIGMGTSVFGIGR